MSKAQRSSKKRVAQSRQPSPTFVQYIRKSILLNLFVIFVISILSNSIYYHFILNRTDLSIFHAQRLSWTSTKPKPSLKSLITWSPASNYLEQSSKFKIKSYEHVFFPSFDQNDVKNEPDVPEPVSHGNKITDDKKFYEIKMALSVAKKMVDSGKLDKAAKIYKRVLELDHSNVDALFSYAEYLEKYQKDLIRAEHFYSRVVSLQPDNNQANLNLKKALPLVTKKDRQMLDNLDNLLKSFYEIPPWSSALKRAKREAYFMHIYHSNAIEGNTLNLQQTRYIVENRMAVGRKSLHEQSEVLGLDAAMRFLNETLMYRPLGHFKIEDILNLHKRVLGFCDPIESGKFRTHQVFVGHFTPPSPDHVDHLMEEFIEWLNSKELLTEAHPVQIAAMAHYKFVYIHPFYDGNGRTARLIMNLLLMKFGYPPIIIKKEDRLEYYENLEMANQGDIKPFIRFVAKCTHKTLLEYIRLCNNTFSLSVDDEEKMFRHDVILNDILYGDSNTGEVNYRPLED